jgi:pimeloyl-ACP methyl ester carboxylesterase
VVQPALPQSAFDDFKKAPQDTGDQLQSTEAKVPGALAIMRRTLVWRWARELPISFGHMTKRGISDHVMRAWMKPLAERAIRRDYCKYAGDTRRGKRDLLAATPALATFNRPVLVVWASEDRIMPPAHGPRLAAAFPYSRLIEIADSYTLIPVDQPALLADHIRGFIRSDLAAPRAQRN